MKPRTIQAFLSLGIIAGIWRLTANRLSGLKGWRRWALLLAAGAATGILIALIVRAFI